MLGEEVRVAGARGTPQSSAIAPGACDGRSGCSSCSSKKTSGRVAGQDASRRGPRGSGARRPRGRRRVFSSSPSWVGEDRTLAEPQDLPRRPRVSTGAVARELLRDPSPGRCEPRSPFVRISRWTSRPAAAHFASVPPAQISASSGWAKTARTGPGSVRRSARAHRRSAPRGPGRTARGSHGDARCRRAGPESSRAARRTPGRRCPGAPTASSPTNSARNQRRRDRAAPALADVLHVGHRRVDQRAGSPDSGISHIGSPDGLAGRDARRATRSSSLPIRAGDVGRRARPCTRR